MKTFWKVAGIAALVVIVGVVGVVAVAAQEAEEGSVFPFDFGARFRQAIADILGISVEEYDAAVDTAQGQVLDQAVDEGWLTQDQADRMQERFDEGFGPGMMGRGGWGMRGGRGRGFGPMLGGSGSSLLDVAAEQLGMTVEDLQAEIKDGKSIADVAEAQGVEVQAIADAFIAQQTEWLNQQVADGKITQKQADWMIEQMSERIQEHLTEPFPAGGCPGFHRGGGMGPGGMMPGFFQGDQS